MSCDKSENTSEMARKDATHQKKKSKKSTGPKRELFNTESSRRLSSYKITGPRRFSAVVRRSLLYDDIDHLIMTDNNEEFKAIMTMSIDVYRYVLVAFQSFLVFMLHIKHPEDRIQKHYDQFMNIVYMKNSGQSKNSYTPKRALVLLLSFYSGTFAKVHSASLSWFENAGKLRNSTAALVTAALKVSHPIQVIND